jgi:hypothetical protein
LQQLKKFKQAKIMKAVKKTTPRVNPPAGVHIALLTQIIDWGTQADKFGGRRKVELVFELPEELHVFNEEKGEQPFIVDRKFALTISKKSALKEALEGMTGVKIDEDEIEMEEYLLTACQLQIAIEQDGEYENVVIQSYMQLSKSDAKRKFAADGNVLILDLDNFDEEAFKQLPDWKQEKIKASPEYKEAAASRPAPKASVKSAPAKAAPAAKAQPAKSSGKAADLFGKGAKKK